LENLENIMELVGEFEKKIRMKTMEKTKFRSRRFYKSNLMKKYIAKLLFG